MKGTLFTTVFLFMYIQTFAQTKTWTTQTTDDSITVRSCVSDTTFNGKSRQLIEYIAYTTLVADYEACANVLKNMDNHKHIFENTESCRKIKEISSTEWLIYYYLDLPWPVPNADAVHNMKFSTTTDNNATVYYLTATPNQLKDKGITRIQFSNSVYKFKKAGDKKVAISIRTKSIPATEAPDWMVSMWFPDGPADMIKNIVKLSQK